MAGLSKSELAALDLIIAGVEDGTIDPSSLGGIEAEATFIWKAVARVTLAVTAAITQELLGVQVAREEDPRLVEAVRVLPASPSLDDLVALRRQVTAGDN